MVRHFEALIAEETQPGLPEGIAGVEGIAKVDKSLIVPVPSRNTFAAEWPMLFVLENGLEAAPGYKPVRILWTASPQCRDNRLSRPPEDPRVRH